MSNANDMAFPVVLENTRTPNDSEQLGLTKREYFAAMAMQGILSNGTILQQHGLQTEKVAEDAVVFADALLTQLSL